MMRLRDEPTFMTIGTGIASATALSATALLAIARFAGADALVVPSFAVVLVAYLAFAILAARDYLRQRQRPGLSPERFEAHVALALARAFEEAREAPAETSFDADGVPYRHHARNGCLGEPCAIHHPSAHHMATWPLLYAQDRTPLMMRRCPHDLTHPDPDSLTFLCSVITDNVTNPLVLEDECQRLARHRCDGCCHPSGGERGMPTLTADEIGFIETFLYGAPLVERQQEQGPEVVATEEIDVIPPAPVLAAGTPFPVPDEDLSHALTEAPGASELGASLEIADAAKAFGAVAEAAEDHRLAADGWEALEAHAAANGWDEDESGIGGNLDKLRDAVAEARDAWPPDDDPPAPVASKDEASEDEPSEPQPVMALAAQTKASPIREGDVIRCRHPHCRLPIFFAEETLEWLHDVDPPVGYCSACPGTIRTVNDSGEHRRITIAEPPSDAMEL